MAISTIPALFEAVGGYEAAAKIAGVSRTAAAMWKVRGRVPAAYYFRFADALGAKAIHLDQGIFSFPHGRDAAHRLPHTTEA